MSANPNINVAIRQYLLGQLTGEAFEQFEERLFADDNLFEEMLATEDDLIDASIAGELSPNESELFTKSFLNTSDGQRKLLFRQVLKNHIKQKNQKLQPVPKPTGWWFLLTHSYRNAIAGAAVIIIAVLIGVVSISRYRPTPATSITLNLTISPGERGANLPPGPQSGKDQVQLPLAVDELRLKLALPEGSTPADAYRVELVKAGERDAKTIETIERDERSVTVAIPAKQLEAGRYALHLHVTRPGQTEQRITGSYYFTVE